MDAPARPGGRTRGGGAFTVNARIFTPRKQSCIE